MKTAVISGGAGGLGQALARALEADGWQTVLLDRDISGLAEVKNRTAMQCDLTDAAQLAQVMDDLISQFPTIDLAIYNAGVTSVGAFEHLKPEAHRTLFEVNYFAAVNMAQALLRSVRAAQGTHLAMSSVAGFSPLFHRTAYAASKHALEGFFASLRSEEAAHNVRVSIAAPSFVATNPQASTGTKGLMRPGSATDGIDPMSPDQAAAIILRGVARGRDFIPVGRVARASYLINRLSPALFRRLMERNIRGG